jgi:hypothetical protein
MKTPKITSVTEAIESIVCYNTLPPQIDYRFPKYNPKTKRFEKMKSI